MLFPLWLENIVVAAQQWLPAALLGGFALFLWRRWPRKGALSLGASQVLPNGDFLRPSLITAPAGRSNSSSSVPASCASGISSVSPRKSARSHPAGPLAAAQELQRREQLVERVRDLQQHRRRGDQAERAPGADHDRLDDDEGDRDDAERHDHDAEQHDQPGHGAPAPREPMMPVRISSM